jgi:hypothetical protein
MSDFVTSERVREKNREAVRRYRAKNLEKIREKGRLRQRRRRATDPEKARERYRQWRAENLQAVREKDREKHRLWRAENREKAREIGRRSTANNMAKWKAENPTYRRDYMRRRKVTDPVFKIGFTLRTRIRDALRGKSKSTRSLELFGCDPAWYLAEVAPHLLREFSERYGVEMTLENHGSTWHWDHCEPLSSFDLTDPAQQRIAFRYDNLRPLPVAVNLSKHNSAPDPDQLWIAIPAAPLAA